MRVFATGTTGFLGSVIAERLRTRGAHHLEPLQIQYCGNCEHPVLPHRVCSNCGHYQGREVVQMTEEAEGK